MENILVVDDDANILKVVTMRLEANGYQVSGAGDVKTALQKARNQAFDLALLDLKLDRDDGIELMEALHAMNPELPVIILTAYGTIDTAVEAMKRGAFSYLTKPFDYQELLLQIRNCLEKYRLTREVNRLKQLVNQKYNFDNIIVKSEKMKKVMDQLGRAAQTESNVYIQGESGTGKELMAKTLHVASTRKDGPFVAINCAAIPENLIESELFGFEKGAFTGATRSNKGLLAQAEGGSVFLDEISEMSLSMQAKLLRALEERAFYPLGASKMVRIDTRFISASNKDLEQEVAAGNFREDLFYRIHVIPIKLPPLRERKEVIPFLARHFLKKYTRNIKKDIKGFTPEAIQKLMGHEWPGNVRELENTVECAVAMAIQDQITDDVILQTRKITAEGVQTFKDAKEAFEKQYITQLIETTGGNVTQAAKLAGKYRADFYDLLRKYGLDPADFREK